MIPEQDKEANWIVTRMRTLLADAPAPQWAKAFCPTCHAHFSKHNDKRCAMRYEEEMP